MASCTLDHFNTLEVTCISYVVGKYASFNNKSIIIINEFYATYDICKSIISYVEFFDFRTWLVRLIKMDWVG